MKEKKQRQKRLIPLWVWVAALSRLLYVFFAQEVGIDTYAYGANAVAGVVKTEAVLTSGLAYAYVQKLAVLLPFFKYDFIWVSAYQGILQIAWLLLLFYGVRTLWGNVAGYMTGTILLISPILLQSVKIIEPVNYLFFHFAVILFLYSVFYKRTADKGWHRSNTGELFLIFVGFYTGVICIWNYISFLLLPVMLYVLIKNRTVLREEIWKQKNIELKENEQIMPAVSQGLILISGMLVGMFATLMKYTGLTGNTVWNQFFWWKEQLTNLPGRCQDVSFLAFLWIAAALFLGIVTQKLIDYAARKQKEKQEYKEIIQAERKNHQWKEEKDSSPEKMSDEVWAGSISEDMGAEFISDDDKWDDLTEEEMQKEYFTTEDGRVVKYIENPLPGPKKHVKREMDFEIDVLDEIEEAVDDFDYKVDKDSDFDFD